MGDVCERAAVDKRWGSGHGLHQVGLQRVLEQHRHGALGPEVPHGDRVFVVGVPDGHPGQAGLQVLQSGGQAEDRHHLRGDGDVEAGLARHAFGRSAQPNDDVAQRAVVHVDDALEGDAPRVYAQSVALVQVVVHQRHEQVVGAGDGMEVTGEVHVDFIHGQHLGVTASGGTALHPEDGAQGWLAQGNHGRGAGGSKRVAQADGDG